MDKSRRNLLKVSVISMLGLISFPAALRAQNLGEHRALLHVRDKDGNEMDFLIASATTGLYAYDVTAKKLKRPYDLSRLKLADFRPPPDDDNYTIWTSAPRYTLKISGGKISNTDDVNKVIPNMWCEVGSKMGKSSTSGLGHRKP